MRNRSFVSALSAFPRVLLELGASFFASAANAATAASQRLALLVGSFHLFLPRLRISIIVDSPFGIVAIIFIVFILILIVLN